MNISISSSKLTEMIFNYKVFSELVKKITECNKHLSQLKDANDRWHPQNSDFFYFLEKRNQSINEGVDILNGFALSKEYEYVRIHKIDCSGIFKEMLEAKDKIFRAILIASSMEKVQTVAI